SIAYDPDYDVIKSEIGKLGGTDYDAIEKLSLKILKEKSKDIRVICYLALCYLKSEAWEKFADVFEGLASLVEQNYDALFPEKERGKQLALKWLSEEKFNMFVEEKKPLEPHYEHIVRLINALNKIKPILESKFPEGSPFPSNLYKMAQQWEKTCKPKPKAEAASREGAPTPGVGGTTVAEPMETPKQAQNIIRKAALFLIEKEPTKQMGYRISRSVRWDLIEKLPPSENGKTQISGPNEQQRAYFQKLVADKEWKTIIEKGEQAFVSGGNHLWLDLQRIIATACKELGQEYAPVYNAILTETALLIKRLPEIINCAFADGTPFCDAATKEWFSSEVKKFMGDESSTTKEDRNKSGGSEDPLAEEQKLVNELIGAGKFEEALTLIQQKIMGSSNERDNFRRRIMIGSILLKAKQPDIAVSVLEALNKKIEESNLDKWDPDTAVEAWSILFSAYKVVKAQKPQNVQNLISEKQNDILGKISKVDAAKAFSINK
ncbi:MAG: type VI secretion system protein TssA, partial [Chitinispirillaceae bacterium]|nr:type VI secretion system protein TssA [Chitinispirillaceae bacterium]